MKILIGYDGSDCAAAALDDLNQAGLPAKAEAHILSIATFGYCHPHRLSEINLSFCAFCGNEIGGEALDEDT